MSHGGEVDIDAVTATVIFELLGYEVRVVVSNDAVRHAETVNAFRDELDRRPCGLAGNRLHLNPLGEHIDDNNEIFEFPWHHLPR